MQRTIEGGGGATGRAGKTLKMITKSYLFEALGNSNSGDELIKLQYENMAVSKALAPERRTRKENSKIKKVKSMIPQNCICNCVQSGIRGDRVPLAIDGCSDRGALPIEPLAPALRWSSSNGGGDGTGEGQGLVKSEQWLAFLRKDEHNMSVF